MTTTTAETTTAPYWESEEYRAANRVRVRAYSALSNGASQCPSRLNQDAFDAYQDAVMQPLRDDLAAAADALAALRPQEA